MNKGTLVHKHIKQQSATAKQRDELYWQRDTHEVTHALVHTDTHTDTKRVIQWYSYTKEQTQMKRLTLMHRQRNE